MATGCGCARFHRVDRDPHLRDANGAAVAWPRPRLISQSERRLARVGERVERRHSAGVKPSPNIRTQPSAHVCRNNESQREWRAVKKSAEHRRERLSGFCAF